MPEGDSIYRTAQTLHRALGGGTITRFETVYAHLSVVHDQSAITGRRIDRVESRGKHVLMWLSGDLVLRTHMRMSGSWHIYRPGERWQLSPSRMRVLVGDQPLRRRGVRRARCRVPDHGRTRTIAEDRATRTRPAG